MTESAEFQNDGSSELGGEHQEMQEVMEIVADEIQENDEAEEEEEEEEEEDAVEAFEAYAQVRRKTLEQKKSRGFINRSEDAAKWRLRGTVQGKLEMIKSRARCHRCKQLGHWKKECPNRAKSSGQSSSDSKKPEVHSAEALVMSEPGNSRHDMMWEMFQTETLKENNVTWESETSADVRNSGFADTHSTGNRQRLHALEMTEVDISQGRQ